MADVSHDLQLSWQWHWVNWRLKWTEPGATGPNSLDWKKQNQCRKHRFSTHTRLTALFPGLPRWAGTRKVKPIWILLKQETVSGSGISWDICKSAPSSRQITTPAPQHSVFYRLDALPAAQPTASQHWRQNTAMAMKAITQTRKPQRQEDVVHVQHVYWTLWQLVAEEWLSCGPTWPCAGGRRRACVTITAYQLILVHLENGRLKSASA